MSRVEINRFKFLKVLAECNKHIKRLDYAFNKLYKNFDHPLSPENIIEVLDDDALVESLDQITYRFSKLQDSMGKVFKLFLISNGENIENMTMIDIINLLEKIEINIDSNEWFELREIRNIIAHEYEDESEKIAGVINKINEKRSYFKEILKTLDRKA
ncbi:MAG: hypothetical protein MAG551_01192 [Candidatus Scalindua arabica]|uniref:Uncharacterized protein n=1 Tax=Candidatus Scalindua arabica TaxID=1127984 RepID=A0A941W244_9BACT|nr:hypothetical protein [Candidatus Scalindua arabica]